GITDGEFVIDLVTKDPQISQITARFIAKKLARHFWGYNPPAELVTEIADAYAASVGDIRAMLRVVLAEKWIAIAPPKLKRPFHYVVSSLRALDADVTSEDAMWGIMYILSLMGHLPFDWAPPNGYPDASAYWSGLILPRWRFGAIVPLQADYIGLNFNEYLADMTTDAFLDLVNAKLYRGAMTDYERAELQQFLDAYPDWEYRKLETIGLALSSPSFQWY
ncbi:MAG: DUF1800 family protein, partial [Candidatus Hydrogenedentales bacterium]